MVLIGKGRLSPDIWPETSQQAKNIENRMKTMLNMGVIRWQKASKKANCLLALTSKEIKYMYAFLFHSDWCQQKW